MGHVHSVGPGLGLGIQDVQLTNPGQSAAFRSGRASGASGFGHKAGGSAPKVAARGVEEAIPSAINRSSLLEEFRNNKNRKFTLQVIPHCCLITGRPVAHRFYSGHYWPHC